MTEPLVTTKTLTKGDLARWLRESDIPDEAELTLKLDESTGNLGLWFYWSFMAGAFGDDCVVFDLESKSLAKEIVERERNNGK